MRARLHERDARSAVPRPRPTPGETPERGTLAGRRDRRRSLPAMPCAHWVGASALIGWRRACGQCGPYGATARREERWHTACASRRHPAAFVLLRRIPMTPIRASAAAAIVTVVAIIPLARGDDDNTFKAKNESGEARTINVAGFPVVARDNPFFLDLGANGRRCVTCHQPAENMSVSAAGVAKRFEKTSGKDPIFRLNDGANSPLADVSTREKRWAAYSMLRTKGLIRVGLPVPPNAEFVLGAVADPYGYAGRNDNGD